MIEIPTFWWFHCETVLFGPAHWTKPDVQVENPDVVGGLFQSHIAEPQTPADVSLHSHCPVHKRLAGVTDL